MATHPKTELVPHTSGIYLIRCRPTGKIYVGSAVDLCRRWDIHRQALRKRKHHNAHLRAAWNLLGEAEFEFEILEYVPKEQLLIAEQKWIDRTDCTHPRIGYNICPLASSQGEKTALTWHGFRDPDGNSMSITNLTRGNPAPTITNLAEFCRANGLDKTHMVAVVNGRIVSHRGWTHVCGKRRKPAPEYTGFVAPGGAFTIIANLSAFCRACDLCVVHMHEVKSGRRPSHKGWTWRDHEESEIAQWRRVAEIHESPHLGNEPLSPATRPQPG